MTSSHIAQIKHAFFSKTKEKSKPQKQIPKKVSLELLHQRSGNRSQRSLLYGDTANAWQYIELRVYPDPFCTSCHISIVNKKPISNKPLNTNTPFKCVFMNIIPVISSKILTKCTNYANELLIMDAYSRIPKSYGMENITTEGVMYKLDMFKERYVEVDEFGWWDMERIQIDPSMKFTSREFQKGLPVCGVPLSLVAPNH